MYFISLSLFIIVGLSLLPLYSRSFAAITLNSPAKTLSKSTPATQQVSLRHSSTKPVTVPPGGEVLYYLFPHAKTSLAIDVNCTESNNYQYKYLSHFTSQEHVSVRTRIRIVTTDLRYGSPQHPQTRKPACYSTDGASVLSQTHDLIPQVKTHNLVSPQETFQTTPTQTPLPSASTTTVLQRPGYSDCYGSTQEYNILAGRMNSLSSPPLLSVSPHRSDPLLITQPTQNGNLQSSYGKKLDGILNEAEEKDGEFEAASRVIRLPTPYTAGPQPSGRRWVMDVYYKDVSYTRIFKYTDNLKLTSKSVFPVEHTTSGHLKNARRIPTRFDFDELETEVVKQEYNEYLVIPSRTPLPTDNMHRLEAGMWKMGPQPTDYSDHTRFRIHKTSANDYFPEPKTRNTKTSMKQINTFTDAPRVNNSEIVASSAAILPLAPTVPPAIVPEPSTTFGGVRINGMGSSEGSSVLMSVLVKAPAEWTSFQVVSSPLPSMHVRPKTHVHVGDDDTLKLVALESSLRSSDVVLSTTDQYLPASATCN